MNRRDDDNFGGGRRENNFDNLYDANQYRTNDRYARYDNMDDAPMRRDMRNERRPRDYDRRINDENSYDNYEAPKKRGLFRHDSSRRRDREMVNVASNDSTAPNQFVVMKPKSFDDIKGIIDNLKFNRALIVDLGKLNDKSIQRVMDYINGAVYAIDGSIQMIKPAVFLLTPAGTAISVPIDYIKDKWERNKKK